MRSELDDIPATVVCATCGRPDCGGGCTMFEDRSGVVTLVPWERRGEGAWSRLWKTALKTTRHECEFFAVLGDGPLAPALGFAIACELLAAGSIFVFMGAIVAAVAPSWVADVVTAPQARLLLMRLLAVGYPAVAWSLVLAHAAHGLALAMGARMSGVRPQWRRALRFGLYAAGWDLVISPVGLVVALSGEGVASAKDLTTRIVGLPGRSARAFVRGAYGLSGASAQRSLAASYIVAFLATGLGVVVTLALVIAIALI